MADSKTTHLELIKQDPSTAYDYEKQDSNLEKLDAEIFARGKKFNGESVGDDGEFHIRMVPFAENLESSASQSSEEEYIIRTSGGEASISDGDAWLTLLRGSRRHINYVPQSIVMTVTPMERQPAPAITAVLDAEVFEAYVGDSGTYTISYTNAWSLDPALYGITVSNTPIDGDSITVAWDGENEPEMTVNAATRPTPESISATIDDEVFVSYVTVSGTTTLTYSTQWSADPTLYGITVTGTPIAGDVITVVYVKEVRGTIIQSNPQTFVSTGWNLFNYTDGYARVIKYSNSYGFKIAGTYTGLEFSETVSGSRITITPVSGYFTIPSDGYVFVSGGNETDTELWMTWSDWGNEPNGGVFAPYETHVVDFSTFMATNFPYGLMQVGTIRDEINLNTGVATSNVLRQAYNATNLANAKASGRQYEYDENYIYIERATAVTYEFTVDGDYVAFDHGMEYFTGTEQAVYAGTIYGANLKNKLERDVLTISQQTLTDAQKSQVRTNIGAGSQVDVNAINTNISKHYIQIAAQSGSTLADSVKATLLQYPYFATLNTGDSVAIAGGWAGVSTYTINFTKEDTYKFAGTVYDNVNAYSFVYNNQQNSLTMEKLALNSDLSTLSNTLERFSNSAGNVPYIRTGNANGITQTGLYYVNGGVANLPLVAGCYVETIVYSGASGGEYIKQIASPYNSQRTFVRTCNNGTWSAWDELALNSNITTVDSKVVALSRHTRKTDFSLSDLQAAVSEQNLAKYGLKPGDQKTINGHTYVIAGLNVMKGTHAYTCTSNHVGLIVIPHTTCKWNASGNTYTGADDRGAGYKNCDLQYYLANDVMQMVNTDLGSGHVYQHKKLFGNAINQSGYNRFGTNSGCTSGWEWADAYISALTEAQVFGGDHWSSSGYDTGEANTLLPVFAEYKHTEIFGNEYVWLRNVSSASQACRADNTGYANGENGVSAAYYVAGLILYH